MGIVIMDLFHVCLNELNRSSSFIRDKPNLNLNYYTVV